MFLKLLDKKIIGLIIGLIFIVLILKNIDIHKSIEAVKHLNFFYVALMVPVYYSSFFFRALRWRTILLRIRNSKRIQAAGETNLIHSENKEIKLTSFLNSILRSWTINYVVPVRGGEIYRAHYFGKKESISRITILASIVLERLLDGFVLFLILLFLVSFVYSSKKFFGVAVAAGIIFTAVFLCLFLASKFYKNTLIQEKLKKFFNSNLLIIKKVF